MGDLGECDMGRDQEMDVVRHHYVSVQLIEAQVVSSVEKGLHHETVNLRTSQIKSLAPLQIEKPIHRSKCLTGSSLFRKDPVLGKGPLEHPRYEIRAMYRIEMG